MYTCFVQRDFAVLNAAGFAIGEAGCKVNLHRLLEITFVSNLSNLGFPLFYSSYFTQLDCRATFVSGDQAQLKQLLWGAAAAGWAGGRPNSQTRSSHSEKPLCKTFIRQFGVAELPQILIKFTILTSFRKIWPDPAISILRRRLIRKCVEVLGDVKEGTENVHCWRHISYFWSSWVLKFWQHIMIFTWFHDACNSQEKTKW